MKTARILISIMAFLSLSARASDTSAIGVGIGNTVFYEVGPVYRQYFNNQLGIIAAVTGKYNQYSKKINKNAITNNEKIISRYKKRK